MLGKEVLATISNHMTDQGWGTKKKNYNPLYEEERIHSIAGQGTSLFQKLSLLIPKVDGTEKGDQTSSLDLQGTVLPTGVKESLSLYIMQQV